jgi:hypothetical protein
MNNIERSDSARKAIDTFSEITDIESEEMDAKISDLLCNLQHLADNHEVDFQECLDRGTRNYTAELDLETS